MDIESKAYRARSDEFGQVTITQKTTRHSVTVDRWELPTIKTLAAMHENKFNATLRAILYKDTAA